MAAGETLEGNLIYAGAELRGRFVGVLLSGKSLRESEADAALPRRPSKVLGQAAEGGVG